MGSLQRCEEATLLAYVENTRVREEGYMRKLRSIGLTSIQRFVVARTKVLLLLLLFAAPSFLKASAQTGYTGIFGGGPLYKSGAATNITELENSGFTEVIVWSVEVSSTGDLNLNGEFPLTSNGVYVGNQTYPNFASDMATLKQGTVKRITFSIGSSNVGDFQDIESLVNSQGTGSSSILYKDFQALKAAIPALDAIDLDDENNFDASSTTAFSVMLHGLGYNVMPDAFDNSSYWTSLVSSINTQSPGTVDGVHLQTYSGGSGNTPCSGWNFGSVPVFAGVWDQDDTASQTQSQMSSWHSQCGITGGFLWIYDDIVGKNEAAQYASAINTGVAGSTTGGSATAVSLTSSYNREGIYSDGTSFASNAGLDGNGYAYSSNLLGSSQSWNGETFSIGAANSSNVVSAAGQQIALPSGEYSTLRMLATGVNGNQASQVFKVTYSDGTTSSFTQSLSDWFTPQGYSGESNAVTQSYRDTSSGGKDSRTFNLYGYSFSLNNTKTVQSVTLPSDSNVEVVSLILVS